MIGTITNRLPRAAALVVAAVALVGCAQVLGLGDPSLDDGPCAADSDGDGVCDENDTCPDGDDGADADDDGVPDTCDPCPADRLDDRDDDGVCDSDDGCPDGPCASCAALLADDAGTADGIYTIDPDGPEPGSIAPFDVFCDMTTDGGGWTRMVHWDREDDPVAHTLASFQAQLIDEIAEAGDPAVSPMSALTERSDHIHWADVDATNDALSYRGDIPVPNSGELLLDLHYEGLSMEQSGVWIHATAAGLPVDLHCYSTADGVANYTPEELALIPYTCPVTTPNELIVNGVEQRVLTGPITAVTLRSLHRDSDADSSNLYRMTVLVR